MGGCVGVQARVKDGFGGERVWRSYWKRKVIPDGLVQRRINQFSAMLPEIGGGEVSTNGRKRKFARDGKWIYTSAANFRILGLVDIIIL